MSAEPTMPLFEPPPEPQLRIHDPQRPAGEIDWDAIAQAEQTQITIPEHQRDEFARKHTLREFYQHETYGPKIARQRRVAAGTLSRNTLDKDVQALNRWERYEPPPADWPPPGWDESKPCPSRPLCAITDAHVNATLRAMDIAGETRKTTWGHLRTILNHAVAVGAIEQAPRPDWGRGDTADRRPREHYNDDQLAQIFLALEDQPDLQTAFVVSVNTGLRPVDLFRLRWESLRPSDRPVVDFAAKKTGKLQAVPLASVVSSHLRRWRKLSGALLDAGPDGQPIGGLVWPDLTSPEAKDPERSRPARRRNKRFKKVLASLGIKRDKPWQAGRVTCNERLESCFPGSGQFVLGHASSLNSRSYREPSSMIYDAVAALPQPECFYIEISD